MGEPLRATELLEPRRLAVPSPVGTLVLVADDRGLRYVVFPNHPLGEIGLAPGDTPERPADPLLAAAATQLEEYFAGKRQAFDLPFHLEGAAFELDVWNALRTIPYGDTISYGEQSERAGHPGAFQAVGAANGRNPLPIILACHRVIGSDGSLVGFGGGLDRKRLLLDLESGVQRLF